MFHLMVCKFILENYFHQVITLHFEMITHVIFWHQLHKHYLFNKNAKIVTYLQL